MPVFGNPTVGKQTEYTYESQLKGSWFPCPEAGQAESITFYVWDQSPNPRIKCAIYRRSDNSLVGYTEEWQKTPGFSGWKTLKIVSGGKLEATDYWLVIWASGTYYHTKDEEVNKGGYQPRTYDAFPDPWNPTPNNSKYSIYCTYTAAPPQWRLGIESTPITGVPITIDGVEVGSTPVSTMVSEGDHTVAVPSEQERSKRS